jgi:hypothetical protein
VKLAERLRVAARLLHNTPPNSRHTSRIHTFFLQKGLFSEWAMLGSNQRPLPCEGRSIRSWSFMTVQKYLQNRVLPSGSIRVYSPLFAWVGVLLVYTSLTVTPVH